MFRLREAETRDPGEVAGKGAFMTIAWKTLTSGTRKRLRCTNCDSVAMEVRSEPVERKRHTKDSNKLRVVARCLSCKRGRVIHYGAPVRG